MKDADKPSPSVVILGIAWIQSLTMATVIDKADMRNVSSAKLGITSPFFWIWDWTKFGGISVVCFLTIPALVSTFGNNSVSESGTLARK